jgi:alcohol dehydrogenase class IV
MQPMTFSMTPCPPVKFGVDRVEKLAGDLAAVAGAGAPALLVADPGLGSQVDRVAALMRKGGGEVAVFTEVRSDPLGSAIDAAANQARRIGARVVVGLGGGSTLDSAKLAAAIAVAERPAEHYALAVNRLPSNPLKKICIPTTAGTGSEATRVSVFNNANGDKVWAWGDPLMPDLSLLDPRLTVGLPAGLTAATGVDALVHAIEAMTIRRANPMNDASCLQAIRLVVKYLPRAVVQPDDLEARGAMQIAACLAGTSIDNSGTGIAHALGHALGAIGHVHHGRAVGLSLRVALAWNAEIGVARHAEVAEALGVPASGRDAAAVAADLAPAFDRFLRRVGMTISLAGDGLGPQDAGRLAATTMAAENKSMRDGNIREITSADAAWLAEQLLKAS